MQPKTLVFSLALGVFIAQLFCNKASIAIRDSTGLTNSIYLPLIFKLAGQSYSSQSLVGSPIAVNPSNGDIWVVNPDSDSVSVIDSVTFVKLDELTVGKEPWSISLSPNGEQAYVVNRADGTLARIDAQKRSVIETLAIGSEPGMLALSPTGQRAYVSITAANLLAVIDTERFTVTNRISVAALPYAVAVSNDSDRYDDDEEIFLAHLLSFATSVVTETLDLSREALVSVIDAQSNLVSKQITLTADVHGFPNLLTGIGVSKQRVWLPHVRAAPDLPNGLTSTVFAAVGAIDRSTLAEDATTRLLLNDEQVFGSPVNNPTAVLLSPDETTLYVVLAGSNLIEVIDITTPTQPRLTKFLSTGINPRGMAISRDGQYGYSMDFLSRSITIFDLQALEVITQVTTTSETLDSVVLRGKQLFNAATDPRLTKGSWISCASCHPDGGSDGVTWFFPDGPRQSPPLWNAANTLPWHWSAALDEAQDVEETIQLIQHGIGLATGEDPPQLGVPNSARSEDLDALATYLQQGIRTPSLYLSSIGFDTDIALGRQLFVSSGCVECHGGESWTISALPGGAGSLDADGNGMVDNVLRDVGTVTQKDIRGVTGFDVPSLLGVRLTAPYLHDGAFLTLEDLLRSGHPTPMTGGNGLNAFEVNKLAAFLRSIDLQTTPPDRSAD